MVQDTRHELLIQVEDQPEPEVNSQKEVFSFPLQKTRGNGIATSEMMADIRLTNGILALDCLKKFFREIVKGERITKPFC